MTNIDPWAIPGWLVYRYFPEARELDHQDFVLAERFAALMGEIGFQEVHVQRTDLSRDEDLREFLAYASKRHRASQLMAISDEAYRAGLQRLEQAVAGAAVQKPVVTSEFVLVTISGDKPVTARAA